MAARVQWNGNPFTTLVEQAALDIELDRWGVAGSTINFGTRFGSYAEVVNKVSNIKRHPAFTWLVRTSAKITRSEADYCDISITFQGVPPDTNEKTYKCITATNSEPIETHPDFAMWAEQFHALFDDKGKLVGWESPEEGAEKDDDFRGIESYLAPNFVYEEVWVRGRSASELRDFTKLGKIEDPPNSRARPKVKDGANFIFLGGDLELIGDGSKLTRRWKASGHGGWNKHIYGTK